MGAQEPNYSITPEKPEAGDTIEIIYSGPLPTEEWMMLASLFCPGKEQIPFHLITDSLTGGKIIGYYAVPDTVSAINISFLSKKFVAPDTFNERPYPVKIFENRNEKYSRA